MARASLVLLLALFLAGAAALPIALATVATKPGVGTPTTPAAGGDPQVAAPLRFGPACADVVSRSDRLLRPSRRLDTIVRGEAPCHVF